MTEPLILVTLPVSQMGSAIAPFDKTASGDAYPAAADYRLRYAAGYVDDDAGAAAAGRADGAQPETADGPTP